MQERFSASSGETPKEREKRLWSFFDAYKTTGEGRAVARPEIAEFTHVTEETKRRDMDLLQQKMGKPQLRQQRLEGPDAFAFENFLTSETTKHRWLGGECSSTTLYDDWVSGVDAVNEWRDDDGTPLRLAIDFTSTHKVPVLMKKSDKLEGNVQVKYLRSRVEREGKTMKELRASMPMVLLGFDTVVFRLIAERNESFDHDHPLRRLLLEQACAQIDLQLKLLLEKTEGTVIVSEKNQQRLTDLRRLKIRLDAELAAARKIPLDADWEAVAEQSITHRVLSE